MKLTGLFGKKKLGSTIKYIVVVGLILLALQFIIRKVSEGFITTITKYTKATPAFTINTSELSSSPTATLNGIRQEIWGGNKWTAPQANFEKGTHDSNKSTMINYSIAAPSGKKVLRKSRDATAYLDSAQIALPQQLKDIGPSITVKNLTTSSFGTLPTSGDPANKDAVIKVLFDLA